MRGVPDAGLHFSSLQHHEQNPGRVGRGVPSQHPILFQFLALLSKQRALLHTCKDGDWVSDSILMSYVLPSPCPGPCLVPV